VHNFKQNQSLTVCIFGLLASSLAEAEVGVVESTGEYLTGNYTPVIIPFYVSAVGAPQNARLDGYAFGDVNRDLGHSLVLRNWYFENYAWNGGDTPPGAASNNNWLDGNNVASLHVTVKEHPLLSGGATIWSNTLSLVQTSVSGNNRFWQLQSLSQNQSLSAGLANGAYTVDFRVSFNFNVWNGSFSQGTSQTAVSTATFNVTPAPGAMALLGAVGFFGGRRRR
jgi:hypothetical protein